MHIVLALAAQPGPGRFSEANLTRLNGFSGVDGPVGLLSDGHSARGLAVLEIEKYRSVVIDPAPQAGDLSRVSNANAMPKVF